MLDTEKIKEMDSHWNEVIKLAEQYGFIGAAYGGTAQLLTNANQLEVLGEEGYIRRQMMMYGRNMEVDG